MKIFWSYAKKDDFKPHNLSSLREAFNIALDQVLGINSEIIFDVDELNWGDIWFQKLEILVKGSDYFLPILTPSYFKSKMCMRELNWALMAGKNIRPILYRDCPMGLWSNFLENNDENIGLNASSNQISIFQYQDFTKLRNKPRDSEDVLNFLDLVAVKFM
jgi:hypothetical protein